MDSYPSPSYQLYQNDHSLLCDSLVQYETYVGTSDSCQPHSQQSYFTGSSQLATPPVMTPMISPIAPLPPATNYPGVYNIRDPHIPTPMSHSPTPSSPHVQEESTIVSVSTAFHPGSSSTPPDLILSSTDSVLFYVHIRIIHRVCPEAFAPILDGLVTDPKYRNTIINVPDSSDVLNVILHCIYGTSCAQNSPSFDVVESAVDRMHFYRISPKKLIHPGTPMYTYILSHSPIYPLRLYSLTAHYNLDDLAVHTSSHLLATSLATITDADAERMGAVYLNRLVNLHVTRIAELKRIVLNPPRPHPATKICDFEDQKPLTRAWALVAAYLAWDARADLSTYSMRSALNPLLKDVTCELCNQALKDRIKDVVVQWASVRRTI